MSGRWRVRRVAKWAGVVCCCLILTAWGLTVNFVRGPNLSAKYFGSHSCVALQEGGVLWLEYVNPRTRRAWSVDRFNMGHHFPWWQGFGLQLPATFKTAEVRFVFIPLWAFFCLVGVPTAALFWRDRRRPKPGHCRKCGYDLTGNVSGVCPECGHRIMVLKDRAGARSRQPQHSYNVPRCSRLLSLAVAVSAFFLLFVVMFYFMLEILPPPLETGPAEMFPSAAVWFLWLLISYFGARFVFSKMRWRALISEAPLCPNCLYNLTGNVSGICPECGAGIEGER